MSAFVIERKHLDKGLSAQDYARYAGFPVTIGYLDQYPHWDKIKNGAQLSQEEFNQRAHAVWHTIQNSEVRRYINPEAVNWAATVSGPGVWTPDKNMFSVFTPGTHFKDILSRRNEQYLLEPTTSIQLGIQGLQPMPIVFPYIYNENIPAQKLFKRYAAFVMRRSPRHASQDFWTDMTNLSSDRLVWKPKRDVSQLVTDIHEARHLVQINTRAHPIPIYYRELDADWCSHETLRRSAFSALTLETHDANLKARYMGILQVDSAYYFAPALEALLGRATTMPNYFDVQKSVVEIQLRLLGEAQSNKMQGFSSEAIQATIAQDADFRSMGDKHPVTTRTADINTRILWQDYHNWAAAESRRTPEHFYTLLREIRMRGDFSNPLTSFIAGRVIEAAEHFGGKDLTHAPNVRQRIRLPNQAPR